MAAIFWHSDSSLFLLPLLLCKWSCSHWCHVYSLLICCQCSRLSTILRSHGARLLFQSHGWSHPLWHWVSTCFLWCQLRSPCQMVGIRIPRIYRQHHYLAWSWWCLVEIHWFVVKRLLPKKFAVFLIIVGLQVSFPTGR